jgi:hypothetical protein
MSEAQFVPPRQPIKVMSEATRTVIAMFRGLDTPEKSVTKEELSAAIGQPVKYGSITTAKKHLLQDYNVYIDWDRYARCFRNMMGEDNLIKRRGDMKSMRRKARCGREKIAVMHFDKLTDEQKIEACAYASIFGVMSHISESSSIKKIESAVTKANVGGIPIGNTLSLFNEQAAKTSQTKQGPQDGIRPQN